MCNLTKRQKKLVIECVQREIQRLAPMANLAVYGCADAHTENAVKKRTELRECIEAIQREPPTQAQISFLKGL